MYEWMAQLAEVTRRGAAVEIGLSPIGPAGPKRRDRYGRVGFTSSGDSTHERASVTGEIAHGKIHAGRVQKEREIQVLVERGHDIVQLQEQRISVDLQHERIAVCPA